MVLLIAAATRKCTCTTVRTYLHGLDFGDVGGFERVERLNGGLQRGDGLRQLAFALVLDALSARRSLVSHRLVSRHHLQHAPQ